MPGLHVPVSILSRFDAILEKRAVAPRLRADYKKWLRYFLDFCSKYPVPTLFLLIYLPPMRKGCF